jgi:threonine aldolase
MQHFASDNNAGICPAALAALERANTTGHETSYGDDRWTAEAKERIAALFETEAHVFFVFNGTAANALALSAMCRSYNSVLCHALSHVDTDESGAPEFFTGGAKLLTAEGVNGKLTPEAVEKLATRWQGSHHVKARVLSITQATEVGTVYTAAEVAALGAAARRHGLLVHMDGARLANAVAHLGCRPADITWRAGVDVLAFGGTKNGLAVGEAIVFFRKSLAEEFDWRVKQGAQLASKMRFITAPWIGLLDNDVWLHNARHANAMARRLADGIASISGVEIMFPVDANAVFADIPVGVQATVRSRGWRFYTFLGEAGCRLMCAWDTTAETVDRFIDDMKRAAN